MWQLSLHYAVARLQRTLNIRSLRKERLTCMTFTCKLGLQPLRISVLKGF